MSDVQPPDSNSQLCASGLILSCKGHVDQSGHVHVSRLTASWECHAQLL